MMNDEKSPLEVMMEAAFEAEKEAMARAATEKPSKQKPRRMRPAWLIVLDDKLEHR